MRQLPFSACGVHSVETSMPPNGVESQRNPNRSPSRLFLVDIGEKLILKFIWNIKGPRIAETTLGKNHEVGGLTLPNIET